MMQRKYMLRIALPTAVMLCTSVLSACKVPVFRYALERWPGDRYRIVVVVPNQADSSAEELVEELEINATNANVDVEVVNLATVSEAELWQWEDIDAQATLPRMLVYYPARKGNQKKCWEGDLSKEAIANWFNSPIRSSIANDIIGGASVIWLLVEGEDANVNDQVAELTTAALAEAMDKIKIPEGVVSSDGASSYLRDHPGASMDDVLRSDVPLRVDFRLRRLKRSDLREPALRTMIAGFRNNEVEKTPLLIPIFGRGRMLEVFYGSDVNAGIIQNTCQYIVGECSCTVKSLNPGVDLIMQVDWQTELGSKVVMVGADLNSEPTLIPIPSSRRIETTTETPDGNTKLPLTWQAIIGRCVALLCVLLLLRMAIRKRFAT